MVFVFNNRLLSRCLAPSSIHFRLLYLNGWQNSYVYTGASIELITDYDTLNFFEESIRGGFCFVSHRYAQANHPALPTYDSSKDNTYIWYIDANNLYGTAMTMPLPISNYRKLEAAELAEFEENNGRRIMEIDDNFSKKGYIFEVDLEYPKELHDLHNDFSLCPERLIIQN